MTKQSKSGEAVKNTHLENRKSEDHITDSFEVQAEGNTWSGQDIEVKSDPLIDAGTGKKVIIRMFQFSANPVTLKKMKPTKQELFNSHAQQIKTMLWADGLKPIETIYPTVNISSKSEAYRIFVTCEAKTGVSILEKSQTLQEITATTVAKNHVSN